MYTLRTLLSAFVFISVALSLFTVGVSHSFAQESSSGVEEDLNFFAPSEDIAPLPNTVACFDYYTFGSVHANLATGVGSVVSGTEVTFSGVLENKNQYPIVDGVLYAKVFKNRDVIFDNNGPDVIDQFVIKGNIAIPAGGAVPVLFKWNVPSYAQSGDYVLATFFTTSRKFNLLGLSFTDDVVGNTFPFSVVGEVTVDVNFDKASVLVDDEPYQFAAFPPSVSNDGQVTVTAEVQNTTNASVNVTVAWTVYRWDAQLRENVVQVEKQTVIVPSRGRAPVSIVVSDARYPVYYVVGELTWKDTSSIIGVRFVRENVDRIRLNFPGVTAFPLQGGAEVTIFSCLHNSGDSPLVSGGRLDLTLTDRNGDLIHEYTYEGDVTSSMMGIADSFVPMRTYDYVRFDARLYQNNTFVDVANLIYDCNVIDETTCLGEELEKEFAANFFPFGSDGEGKLHIIIGIGLLLLVGVSWYAVRVRRNTLFRD